MIFKAQAFTKASKSYNEDGYYKKHPVYFVADGATGLYPKNKSNHISDASKMVRFLTEKFDDFYNGDFKETLYNISKAYQKIENFNTNNSAAKPSAGIAAIVERKDAFYAYLLGDCEIVTVTRNNIAKRYVNKELKKLDEKALDKMQYYTRINNLVTAEEKRAAIKPILIKHRNMMNRPNGYNVFTIDDNPDFYIREIVIPKNNIKTIYLYTDGFAQIFDTIRSYYRGYKKVFSNSLNPEEIINLINNNWNRDYNLQKYPRFKQKDDITVLKLHLK
ncbi:MAG: hypothetical protein ACOCU2_00010 [Bacillota bacterium]